MPLPGRGAAWTAPRHGFDPSTSTLLPETVSATSEVYSNVDGSRTIRLSAGPINYRAADGSWHKVDLRLTRSTDGRLRTTANSVTASFAGLLTTKGGLTTTVDQDRAGVGSAGAAAGGDLATVTLATGEMVGYSLQGAAIGNPSVSGSVALYADVLAGTDLQLETLSTGVKETLVLKSRTAANSWTFPLTLRGLTAQADVDGSVRLRNSAGQEVAKFPRGFMEDSRRDPASGDGVRSEAVQYKLVTLPGGGLALQVTADRAWLDDPSRVFPVRVDPTAVGAGFSTFAQTGWTGDNSGSTILRSGTYDGGTNNALSYMTFNALANIPAGSVATSAQLEIHSIWSGACSSSRPMLVSVSDPASSWSPSSVTWTNKPALGTKLLDSYSVAPSATMCGNTAQSTAVGTWWGLPLTSPNALAVINRWLSGGANYGLALSTATPAGGNSTFDSWLKFSGAPATGYAPVVDIDVTPNSAPQITSQYPVNGYNTPTLSPELLVGAVDADSGPQPMKFLYSIYNTAGVMVTDSGGYIAARSWRVPDGILTWGNTYYWSVSAYDGRNYSATQAWNLLSTAVPQPPITSGLSQNSGYGFDAAIGNYTSSATDAQVATYGPALTLQRYYNSRDPRTGLAFGTGWSSVLDSKVTESGATVAITYPSGQDVAFGRRADGSFAPPPGRYSVLKDLGSGTGYELTDKDGTRFRFTKSITTGVFGLVSITDGNGRALTLDYTGSQVTSLTAASGRKLAIGWTSGRVSSVTTPTSDVWAYNYTGSNLTSVCPPTTPAKCTVYAYQSGSLYPTAVLDAGPHTYLRLSEPAGAKVAQSSATDSLDTAAGSYANVTLGQPGPLAGSTATAASFNGSSSSVELTSKVALASAYQSVSLWFKTSVAGGVLLSYSKDPITAGSTVGNYTPSLYIGANGDLYGQFWNGNVGPIHGPAVADNAWHHAVLSAAGGVQTLYVDGVTAGTASGPIAPIDLASTNHQYLGTGFLGGAWPSAPSTGDGVVRGFNGILAEVAFYTKPLTKEQVQVARNAGVASFPQLNKITRPSGGVTAQVAYDPITGVVTSVTDANGGTWQVAKPNVAPSSSSYVAAVLGASPADYYRLKDTSGTPVTNEVNGNPASYSLTTSVGDGPFADTAVTSFNGTSSYVQLPNQDIPSTGPVSMSMWFKMPAGSVAGGVLYSYQAGPLSNPDSPNYWTPALYVGTDGLLRGGLWMGDGGYVLKGPKAVNDGLWHHVALTANAANERLYLDGAVVGSSTTHPAIATNAAYAYLGAGKWDWWPVNGGAIPPNKMSYWPGQIAEFAYFNSELTGQDIAAQAGARDAARPTRQLPADQVVTTGPNTVSLWFQLPTGSTSGGVLYGYQNAPLTDTSATLWNPALYVGIDGKLRGEFWNGSVNPITTTTPVNDGLWHHAVLSATTSSQTLYLDGNPVGSRSGAISANGGPYNYLGATKWASWTNTSGTVGSWPGQISGFTFANTTADATAVTTMFQAGRPAGFDVTYGLGAGQKTIAVTDPKLGTITYGYDVSAGGRLIWQTDQRGSTTRYGYDSAGFLKTTTDPNGNVSQDDHDVRGNILAHTTCQDRSAAPCSTTYYSYYPAGSEQSATLTPDPRNDKMLTSRDPRSSSKTDNTYLTSYTYDTFGNLLTVTDPLGRVSTTSYTDGVSTSGGVPGGAVPPKGLAYATTASTGAVTSSMYAANGDVLRTLDAVGLRTDFTYDASGRALTQTVISDAHPSGLTTTLTYDKVGRILTETDPAVVNRVTGATHTRKMAMTYDDDGHMLTATASDLTGGDAPRVITSHYDAFGRLDWTLDALNKQASATYDVLGRKITQTDQNGVVTAYSYDPTGNLTQTVLKGYTGDPNNPTPAADQLLETRAYDPAGRLASVTDAMGWVTSYTYTDNNLPVTVTRSDGGSQTYVVETDTYDRAGNITRRVTNNGTTRVDTTLDAASRPTRQVVDPTGAVNRITDLTYRADDQVLTQKISDGSGAAAYMDATYDLAGRKTSAAVRDPSVSGPSSWWQLNEGLGASKVYDSSVIHREASVGSGVTLSGGAGTWDGTTNATVTTSTPGVDLANSFTVSAWANLADTAAMRTVVSQDVGTSYGFFLDYRTTNNTWNFSAAGGSVAAGAPEAVGTWVHLTALWDKSAGKVYLYVNGALQGSASANTSLTSTGSMSIGRKMFTGSPVDFFKGQIDNVQVYPRALSAAEVSSLYGRGRGGSALGTSQNTSSVYDKRGLVTASIDPLGNVTDLSYDEAGRLVVSTAPAVSTEENGGTPVVARPTAYVGYDTFGGQTEAKDPKGRIVVSKMDANGRVIETDLPSYTPPGGSPISPVAKTFYDNAGRVIKTTDALLHDTTTVYDQLGRVAKVTAPDGGVTKATYDLVGDVLTTVDPMGAQSAATYDYLGRKATASQVVRQPSTQTFTTTYAYYDPSSGPGWLKSTTPPGMNPTSYEYNSVGETTKVTDPAANATTYTYDFAGRQISTKLADNTTQVATYDGAGNVAQIQAKDATGTAKSTSTATYDPAGQTLSATDPNGHATTFAYNALGQLITQVEPLSATDSITSTFGYDLAGARTRFTDGRGSIFVTTYNTLGLPESTIEPATSAYPNAIDRTFTTVYNANGQAVEQRSPGNVKVTNTLDVMGRVLTSAGTGAEVSTVDKTYTYDLAGRPLTLSGSGGTNTVTWDDRGLLLTATGGSGNSSFAYNSFGAMTTRTDAAGTTTYGYTDSTGRLTSVSNPTTSTTVGFTYNSLNQPSQITYGATQNRRILAYDDLHRLTTDELRTSGGTSIAKIVYGYDTNGNETSKTTTGFAGSAANTYTYDWANRLTSWNNGTTNTAYTYDKAGNRTQAGGKTFTYDQRNQLLTSPSAGTSYVYTARGTLQRTTTGTVNVDTKNDAFGQTVQQYNSAGTVASTYTYDGLGRAIRAGHSYTGLGNDLAADTNATYTRDPSGALLGVKQAGAATYAWTDLHTDVVGQFTATATSLGGSTTYDPLGKAVTSTGMVGNLGYQSEYTDTNTGRVNMAARWYNPDTGQFDNRDPASNTASPSSANANRYAYGNSNPLTLTDPSGHYAAASDTGHGGAGARTPRRDWLCSEATNQRSAGCSTQRTYEPFIPTCTYSKVDKTKDCTSPKAPTANRQWGGGICEGTNGNGVCYHPDPNDDGSKTWTYTGGSELSSWYGDTTWGGSYKVNGGSMTLDEIIAHDLCPRWGEQGQCVFASELDEGTVREYIAKLTCYNNPTLPECAIGKGGWGDIILAAGALTCVAASATIVGGAICFSLVAGLAALSVGLENGESGWDLAKHVGQDMITAFVSTVAGGKAAEWAGKAVTAAGRVITGTLAGAGTGGLESGGYYALGCIVGRSCTADGFRESLKSGLATGALFGAGGAVIGELARSRACHSFDPDTRVLMAGGTTLAIKDVEIGDEVIATDPETGITTTELVTALHLNQDWDLADITVTSGAKPDLSHSANSAGSDKSVLHTTWHHPFWDRSIAAWVDASDLRPGQSELVGPSGQVQQVVAVRSYLGNDAMRDLTIDKAHTYYVIAGETPVLVHNCTLPKGFSGREHYNQFVNTLEEGLAAAGYGGVSAQFRGSSVTGIGYKSGKLFGSHSDYDIDLIGESVFGRARQLGVTIKAHEGGIRTHELDLDELDAMGLIGLKRQLDSIAGRPVNFVLFPNLESATARGRSTLPAVACQCS